MTLARGARQFVVHEALETMSMSEVYLSSLTPNTNMGASAEGAEMMTFFAPPLRCAAALSLVVKTPCTRKLYKYMRHKADNGGSNLKRTRTHSRLDDVLNALLTPRNVRGVPLGKDRDGPAVDDELAILGFDGTLEAAVGRIVLKHVRL